MPWAVAATAPVGDQARGRTQGCVSAPRESGGQVGSHGRHLHSEWPASARAAYQLYDQGQIP